MATTAATYREALDKIGVAVPGHLVADAEVPVLTGPQRQGDISIWPVAHVGFTIDTSKLSPVPDNGIQVVRGEATGNTHWLHRGFGSPGVAWYRIDNDPIRIGVIHVPAGQTAELIHTDEHGCNSMGPGTYVLHGKREMADQIRRVAD